MGKRNGIDLYRYAIPEDVREHLKKEILEAKMDSYDGFVKTAAFIMAHMLSLDIPPEVAKEVRGYLELIFTAITARAMAERDKSSSGSSLAARLARDRKVAKGGMRAAKPVIELVEHLDGALTGELAMEPQWDKVVAED